MSTLDIAGLRFDQLTAIKPLETRDKHRNIVWECLCSCGKITCVVGRDLINGHTKSCGCLQRDTLKKRHRQYRYSKNADPNMPMSNQARFIRWEVDKVKKHVKQRDYDKCVLCGIAPTEIHIHHITPLFEDVLLAAKLSNLVCLCNSCHKKAHPNGSKSIDEAIRQQLRQYILGVSNGI
jgi:5-methylcytosine-specific restriction endonuclease McrA